VAPVRVGGHMRRYQNQTLFGEFVRNLVDTCFGLAAHRGFGRIDRQGDAHSACQLSNPGSAPALKHVPAWFFNHIDRYRELGGRQLGLPCRVAIQRRRLARPLFHCRAHHWFRPLLVVTADTHR
jgi:hypothetical protein